MSWALAAERCGTPLPCGSGRRAGQDCRSSTSLSKIPLTFPCAAGSRLGRAEGRRQIAQRAPAVATGGESGEAVAVRTEGELPGMTAFLDSLKYDAAGLVAVIVQHVDTGEVLMQAFADRAALNETLQTRMATFYSRSRGGRWCKGETSGHFIRVLHIYPDCDRDSIIYLGDPIGPACHTGSRTCWFTSVSSSSSSVREDGEQRSAAHTPATTLYALEATIGQRRVEMEMAEEGRQPSWTAKLLSNPRLLCKKVREEAGELCQTLEEKEGPERAASEMADLLYHSLVLLHLQGVSMEDVLRVLRARFGTSGVEEKAARPPKKEGGAMLGKA